MLNDILRQPVVRRDLYERRESLVALGREWLTPGPQGRLHAFGCGDGWFAARAVAAIAPAAFGIRAEAATSLEMVADKVRAFGPQDRAVAISMSGSVDRTNAAAAAIVAAGGGCVALSNEDGGPLGRIAGRVASLHVPDIAPFLTGTTRYSATVLALMMLMDGAGGTTTLQGRDIRAFLDDGLPEILADAQRFSRILCPQLADAGIGGVRILGAGPDWATADYGAAKLVKLIDLPVWAGEIEEFAHSQFWSSRGDELVLLLAGSRDAARMAENTAEALAMVGMRTLAIETAGEPVPSATYRLTLPAFAPWLAPLAMPAPLQLFAYHLARAMGKDPDVSQDQESPGRFLAAQMLSRRCELSPP
jgi:fructoselysine-6-P-deglycase FrlB-like protein